MGQEQTGEVIKEVAIHRTWARETTRVPTISQPLHGIKDSLKVTTSLLYAALAKVPLTYLPQRETVYYCHQLQR